MHLIMVADGNWRPWLQELPGGQGVRVQLQAHGAPLSFRRVLSGWRETGASRALFSELLAGMPFTALRWEVPPLTRACLSRPFECVVLDSPGLDRPADPAPFTEHFRQARGASVLSFDNPGGDATLVVPCPEKPGDGWTHLARFLREAPVAVQHALWRSVAETTLARLGARPLWLNTAGGGVDWLHVRLDDRPKYYAWHPYRHWPRQPGDQQA